MTAHLHPAESESVLRRSSDEQWGGRRGTEELEAEMKCRNMVPLSLSMYRQGNDPMSLFPRQTQGGIRRHKVISQFLFHFLLFLIAHSRVSVTSFIQVPGASVVFVKSMTVLSTSHKSTANTVDVCE